MLTGEGGDEIFAAITVTAKQFGRGGARAEHVVVRQLRQGAGVADAALDVAGRDGGG